MARENQGLHIALIAFVVLTIFLAVFTFVFFSQAREAKNVAAKEKENASKAETALRLKITEMGEIQKLMGFDEKDTKEAVVAGHKEDMDKYATAVHIAEESNRVYRQLVRRLSETLEQRETSLAIAEEGRTQAEEQRDKFKKAADDRVKKAEKETQDARDETARERQQFEKDRARMKRDQETIAEDHRKAVQRLQAKIRQQTILVKKLTEDNKIVHEMYVTIKRKIDAMIRPKPSRFHGLVRWVDRRGKTVWINLGSADAVRPQTKFSVYPSDANTTSEVLKKASIEVTRIRGDHLAEARILDDSLTDPILVGDRIYTPIWNVGEKRHFALAGIIDLDNDGLSDLARMHALIRTNGGVVDAQMDAAGNRRGEMTMNTTYLVLGEAPGVNAPAEWRADYSKITRQAEKLGVATISLQRFLDLMGWVRSAEVANYGEGGAKQFPVDKSVKPTPSHGGISGLFKPRKPGEKKDDEDE
jgi:hypothetical protein